MRLPTPLLRKRKDVHKNNFGHALILAGSPSMLGAACLAGLSAMRAGVGLLTIGVPQSLNLTLQKKLHSTIMTWPLPDKEGCLTNKAAKLVNQDKGRFNALAVGPGMGINRNTEAFLRSLLLKVNVPMVIDADGLNALAKNISFLSKIKTPIILTPHEGEMARLIGKTKQYVHQHRKGVVQDFIHQYPHVVLVLKGPTTLVAAQGKRIYLNKTGNPGLAKAGSGDVLTGILVALLAQGIDVFEAAKTGVYLHGLAADCAIKKIPKVSLLATDVVESIQLAIKKAAE